MVVHKNGEMRTPLVPVSWGELIDKITILEIKVVRLRSAVARENALKELELLSSQVTGSVASRADIAELREKLAAINRRLWSIEDWLRTAEARSRFDCRFLQLARCVYVRNDERAAVKREINLLLSSELIEEKSYSRDSLKD
jgi:hypothetical protein